MRVDERWVTDHKTEIEREAYRLHGLRKVFCPELDTPHDNFITACNHVWQRHEVKVGTRPD